MDRPICSECRYFVPFPNPDRGRCFGHAVRGKSSCRQFRPREPYRAVETHELRAR